MEGYIIVFTASVVCLAILLSLGFWEWLDNRKRRRI